MVREYGVQGSDLAGSPSPLEAWRELAAFLEGAAVVVADHAQLWTWSVALAPTLRPATVIDLASVAALIAPGRLHLWFFVASATALLGVWGNYTLTRVAEREPENAEALAAYGREGYLAAYGPLMAWVLFGLLAGGLARVYGETGAPAVALNAIANLLVFGLILWVADSWRQAVRS